MFVKDYGLFPFQNLQEKTFDSSCFFYVWVNMVKKVLHTCSSTFDNFAGHSLGLF